MSASIAQAVDREGFAIIRDCIDADAIEAWREAIDHLHAVDEQYYQQKNGFDPAHMKRLAKGEIYPSYFADLTGLKIADLCDVPILARTMRHLLIRPAPYNNTINSVGNASDAKLNAGIPIHTDGIIQGTTEAVVTLWMPLHACGVSAPGLKLFTAGREAVMSYLQSKFTKRQIPGWSSQTDWGEAGAFEEAALVKQFGPAVCPALSPGDAVIFTNWTLHGSAVTPEMNEKRSAAIQRWKGEGWRDARERTGWRYIRSLVS